MMMLRSKMSPNLSLYALVTDKDLLDEYVGSSLNDIPESVRNTIVGKSKKLG